MAQCDVLGKGRMSRPSVPGAKVLTWIYLGVGFFPGVLLRSV